MGPAGTGGLAKVTAEACAHQHVMGSTMTLGMEEILNFFESGAFLQFYSILPSCCI